MYIENKRKYINLSAKDLKDLMTRLEKDPRNEKRQNQTLAIFSTFDLDNEFFIDNFIKTHFVKGVEYSQSAIEEAFNKFRKMFVSIWCMKNMMTTLCALDIIPNADGLFKMLVKKSKTMLQDIISKGIYYLINET